MAETRTRGIVLFGGLAWFTTGPLFARRHLNCRTQGSRSGRGEGPPGPPPHDGGGSSRPSRPSSFEDPSAGRLYQHHEVIQPVFGPAPQQPTLHSPKRETSATGVRRRGYLVSSRS